MAKIDYKKTRGWRNNNPLNLVRTDTDWQGMADKQTDARFITFIHITYGYRAAIKNLQGYANRFKIQGKLLTIDNIIRRWCPDGHEEGYIKKVCELTKIDRYRQLPEPKTQNGYDLFVKIMGAMTVVECGCPWSELPWTQIKGGYWMAYHLKNTEV